MRAADIAAVVLTYGPEPHHEPIVHDLCHQGIRPDRISVVHNPVSASWQEERCVDGIEIVRNARNLGYGSAINIGLRRSRVRTAPAVFIVADDVSLKQDAVAQLLAGMEAHPQIGIFGTKLLLTTGETWSVGGLSEPGGWVSHLDAPRALLAHGVGACDWVDAAAWAFRADVLRDVGLLEERYFMYYEEPLICLKARRAGWGIGTVLGAVAKHTPGSHKRPAAYEYLMTRNGLHYSVVAGGPVGGARAAWNSVMRAAHQHRLSRDVRTAPDERTYHELRRIGIIRGMRAAARSQWGPPPRLPGASDILVN